MCLQQLEQEKEALLDELNSLPQLALMPFFLLLTTLPALVYVPAATGARERGTAR
jgi:uncharacterized membrane protein YGL010W